jgi:AraC-like DNA-binding protein
MAKTSILVSLKSFTRERITFHLFIIIILTISIVLLGLIAQIFFTFEQLKIAHQVMSILITGLLIYLHLLVRKFPHSASDVHIEYQKVKYENSNLRNVDLDQIQIKLTYLLEVEKVYADNELSLDKLATQLEIGSHKLSQYINEIMKSTFYDLINHYRLLASESLLLKNPDRTVLSIALEVGFSSQSTFYSAFGKKWKMSPNAYRKTYGLQDQKATHPDTRMSN